MDPYTVKVFPLSTDADIYVEAHVADENYDRGTAVEIVDRRSPQGRVEVYLNSVEELTTALFAARDAILES